jgi:hypothetical protein
VTSKVLADRGTHDRNRIARLESEQRLLNDRRVDLLCGKRLLRAGENRMCHVEDGHPPHCDAGVIRSGPFAPTPSASEPGGSASVTHERSHSHIALL